MRKKKCIAMLLAGGQGTRLYALTDSVAKPAVSFGSKYRIIDFPLSNCANSGIDTVGVLTQYRPLVLNEYIGGGEPWDLDRTVGGVHILPPYQDKGENHWYKGTADAIKQNLEFLNRFDSEHVLILSGDHIYKMDYSLMLDAHIASDAECTIAVIDVPEKEASRFGIMEYDESRRITAFEEKPAHPKSNHASMGIYIFKKDVLVDELIKDSLDKESQNDFGKNIIPKMLNAGKRMFAYNFVGYWKDVGTVTSLWEANMDLLGPEPLMDLYGADKIYSRNESLPPMYVGKGGSIKNSLATAGCKIYGTVENSVLSEDVYIGRGSKVRNSVIMRGTYIGENVDINYGMIDEYVHINNDVTIGDGDSGKDKIALIGKGSVIGAGKKILSGEIVEGEK